MKNDYRAKIEQWIAIERINNRNIEFDYIINNNYKRFPGIFISDGEIHNFFLSCLLLIHIEKSNREMKPDFRIIIVN